MPDVTAGYRSLSDLNAFIFYTILFHLFSDVWPDLTQEHLEKELKKYVGKSHNRVHKRRSRINIKTKLMIKTE